MIGLPQSLYYADPDLKLRDVTAIKEKIALGLGLAEEEDRRRLNDQAADDRDYWGDDKVVGAADGSPGINETWMDQGGDEWGDFQMISKPVNTSKLDTPEGLALAHSRVIFTWREKESYEEALQLYPFVRNVLVPDMGFQLGPYQAIRRDPDKLVDLVLFLRADHESLVQSTRNAYSIQPLLPKPELTFRVVDWPDRLDLFGQNDIFFTETAIQLLSLGKVVVCDRLHAAVLAYESGLPFVYIDQVSGKITKTLGGAFDGLDSNCMKGELARWARASSMEEALRIASQMIDRHQLDHGEERSFWSRWTGR